MSNMFKYGEFEGRFDPTDYIQLEAYEAGLNAISKASEDMKSEPSNSKKLRVMALAITDDFIDGLFGDGAANLMFGDGISSLNELYNAVAAIIKFAKDLEQESSKQIKDTVAALGGNRANRRAK